MFNTRMFLPNKTKEVYAMKIKKNWFYPILTAMFFSVCPVSAFGAEPDGAEDDVTLAPYFFIKDGDSSVDQFPLKKTSVTTNINGVIAETYVTQTYENKGEKPIDASYLFPASTRVSVHGMKMVIGDEIITARIREREEAKQEFEEAKEEGKSASLLEQQRPNVFTMDVANVMPGDVVNIELHYTEMIESTEGTYQFAFPTVVGPRYAGQTDAEERERDSWVQSPYLGEGEKGGGEYDITVNLSTGVAIGDLSCKSHKVNIRKSEPSVAQVTLADPGDFAGDRDFILDYKLTGSDISSGLMLNQGEDENFFLLTVQPPERFKPEEIPPREYIFVLDVSGSMYGYPLDTAKELIRNLASGLRGSDRFNLLLFSGASSLMSQESVPATSENIRRAIDFIDQENGGGGTELAPALNEAIGLARAEQMTRNIVIATDGYISGEKEIFDLIDGNLNTTSFFAFGIGDSVNRYLIEGIAKAGQGEAFLVTDSEDAAETAGRFKTYIEAPLLTDIQISYDGFDVYDTEPSSVPALFAQRPVTIFGKWKGEPAGTIRITGKTGGKDYEQEIDVSQVKSLAVNDAIRYLWARKRVEQLTDYGSGSPNQEDVKEEVTWLGLNYSMMTPYTSFVAVSEKVRNPDGNSTEVEQPQVLPHNVSNFAVGGYTTGSEPGTWLFAFAAVLMLVCGLRGKRGKRS